MTGAGADRPEDPPDDPSGPGERPDNAEGGDDFDAVFRSIVDNYGDRPALPALPAPEPNPPATPAPDDDPVVSPGLFRLAGEQEPQPPPDHQDHFVPPEPPPLPWPEPNRGLAWLALFGSPTLMLGALLLSVSLPSWVTTLLGFSFIGGFVYLVATMRRGPSDGWDDGARL